MLLLAVLRAGPGHGYELRERLAERSGGALEVPEGSLYPALHKLERGGQVASAWDSSSGRRRRVYRLTRSGRRALQDGQRGWRALSDAVERVLAVPA
jgi:PadR family transcriptional regulator PadR